jgi:hypothetical protein
MKGKWLALTGLVLLIAGAAIYFYLRFRKSDDFEGLIKTKIASLVNKGSDGLYIIGMDDIEIDILNSSVIAQNVILKPDSARMKILDELKMLPDEIYNISVKAVAIKGISPEDFINTKNISLKQVFMDAPDVIITHKKRPYSIKDTGNLYSRISGINESYELKNLTLQNINLTYKDLSKNGQVSTFQNLTAVLNDIKIDKETSTDSSRFLFAKDALMYLKKYAACTTDKMYRFTIDSVSLKPMAGLMTANNIRLTPQGSKDEFSKKLKVLKDRFDIHIKEASIKNINWWSLISNEGFTGGSMNLSGGYISVYDDRRLPQPASKMGNYPHQLLMKMPFPVMIKSISIKNIDVSYEEFNPAAGRSGCLTFNNTSAELNNITNIAEFIDANPLMKVSATTSVMNQGKLNASLSFNLAKSAEGSFTADAVMGPMDATIANKALTGLALVEIEKMQIDQLETHVSGTNYKGSAEVKFAYHDLKIAALKKDKEAEGKLKKRELLSFIANTFVVKSSSPAKSRDAVKTQVVTYERDPKRSFFNLVWQTVAKGIILTAKGK